MKLMERLMLLFCVEQPSCSLTEPPTGILNALDQLRRVFPDFSEMVSGKRVLDFGSGFGYQSIALAQEYGCSVVGVESNLRLLKYANENARRENLFFPNVRFAERISSDFHATFDVVISHNSFEHFHAPAQVLEEMSNVLTRAGLLLITFGPPWYAPYGSHMHFFCKIPWLNLIFPERVVMSVRSRFRNDGAKSYDEVESGLNKMSVRKFESIVRTSQLRIQYKNYECIKGMNWLGRIPIIRELFINNISAMLTK